MSERRADIAPAAGPALDLCPECDRDLVYPIALTHVSETHCEVLLRCPNCEWTRRDLFEHAALERLDEQLDAGMEALERDLERLERANLEDAIERFAHALRADAILPEDF
jgi:hypothetical protein